MKAINTNLSYYRLRKLIGASGMLLPFIVWVGAWEILPSISDYYYTYMGIAFVTILMWCGAFLIAYRGYKETSWITDNGITTIGGILIMLTVIFPTPYDGGADCPTAICFNGVNWPGYIHFGSASLFFGLMGALIYFNFTLPRHEDKSSYKSPGKISRNKLYRSCAWGMWVTLALTFIGYLLREKSQDYGIYFKYSVFIGELIILQFFGIAWLVKGKALYDLGWQKEDGDEVQS
ncbi:MAG: hypothetical protein JXR07_05000 [Reichenbachiella sp.]